jgi:predicted DNA-binding protein (MmcQ/YjbR family)
MPVAESVSADHEQGHDDRAARPVVFPGVFVLGQSVANSDLMNAAELRDSCLSLLGSEEVFPFGPDTSVFKVAGKIFAISPLASQPLNVSVKCDPALAEELRGAHRAVTPGYHLNKRHWNTVTIDGSLPDEMVANMIEDSYDLILSSLSRVQQRRLGWRVDP